MVTLKDVIIMSMKEYGYKLENYEPKDYLFFSREGSFIIVNILDKEVTSDDVIKFYRDLEQYIGTKILICLQGYKKDAEIQAEKLNIILEDRNDIVQDLGEFVFSLIMKNDERIKEILNLEDVEVEEETEENAEENQETIPIFLENVKNRDMKIINPLVSRETAIEKSSRIVQGFDARLVLTPFYVFEYKLEVQVEGTMIPKKVFGKIAINGVNEKVKYIKTGLNIVSELKLPFEMEDSAISMDDAESIAKDEILHYYTKEEEIKIEKETVTIIERKRSIPKENTLTINFIGLYYWPFWVVSGSKGNVIIDAVDGDFIEKHYL